MVSIGTIFSIAAVGAVIAGAVALYSNRDKIGGALSRGIETNLTNPLGNYFDNLWKNAPGNATTPGSGIPNQAAPDVNPLAILNPIPTATAQTPTGDTAITTNQAKILTDKYLPKATKNAETALRVFESSNVKRTNPSVLENFIKNVQTIGKQSPTPELSTNFAIVDKIRESVSGTYGDSSRNKFYNLFTLSNKPYGNNPRPLPLTQQAVLSYAKMGVVAREVYL